MSYDLYFWRQAKDLVITPKETILLLSKDEPVDGVTAFPQATVRMVLKKFFPEIQDQGNQLEWEGAGSYFLVSFNYSSEVDIHLIIVNCGFKLLESSDTMNRIIEACNSMGCALYDSQTNQRYQQPAAPTP